MLLDAGADILAVDSYSNSVLHTCAQEDENERNLIGLHMYVCVCVFVCMCVCVNSPVLRRGARQLCST